MRPNPTHLSLAALAVALGLLGTVSYVGVGDDSVPQPNSPATAQTSAPLTTATDPDATPTSTLAHPLIGTPRDALRQALGTPTESYVSGAFAFLTFRDGDARYQVVLQNDVVVEVSRIN